MALFTLLLVPNNSAVQMDGSWQGPVQQAVADEEAPHVTAEKQELSNKRIKLSAAVADLGQHVAHMQVWLA